MPEACRRSRNLIALISLLVLSGCGQTGPLVLPGSVPPSSEAATQQPEEEEDDEEAQR